MRIWDIDVSKLCNKHLLGEHKELHAIWNIHTKNKKGYSHHPEVKRWKHYLVALYYRHELQSIELLNRHMNHKSFLYFHDVIKLENTIQIDSGYPNNWQSKEIQIEILKKKGCDCKI